jgi:hypothetical protein
MRLNNRQQDAINDILRERVEEIEQYDRQIYERLQRIELLENSEQLVETLIDADLVDNEAQTEIVGGLFDREILWVFEIIHKRLIKIFYRILFKHREGRPMQKKAIADRLIALESGVARAQQEFQDDMKKAIQAYSKKLAVELAGSAWER